MPGEILDNNISELIGGQTMGAATFGDGGLLGFNLAETFIGATLGHCKATDIGDDNFSKGILGGKVNTQTIGLSGDKANMTGEAGIGFK